VSSWLKASSSTRLTSSCRSCRSTTIADQFVSIYYRCAGARRFDTNILRRYPTSIDTFIVHVSIVHFFPELIWRLPASGPAARTITQRRPAADQRTYRYIDPSYSSSIVCSLHSDISYLDQDQISDQWQFLADRCYN